MKRINKTTGKLLIAALAATCLFATVANAQPLFKGKFSLPYEVRWGKAVLPAGEYTLSIENTSVPVRAIVQAADGKAVGMLLTANTSLNAKGPSALLITHIGDQRRVRSLNLAELGMVLIYAPLSEREREIVSAANKADVIPIVPAN